MSLLPSAPSARSASTCGATLGAPIPNITRWPKRSEAPAVRASPPELAHGTGELIRASRQRGQIERTGSGALEDCAHIGQRGGKLARALDEIARHVEERAFQIIDFVSQGVDLGLMARAEFADGSGHNIENESHALVVGPAQASALVRCC